MPFSVAFPEAHEQSSLCPAPKGTVGGIGSVWPSVRGGGGGFSRVGYFFGPFLQTGAGRVFDHKFRPMSSHI